MKPCFICASWLESQLDRTGGHLINSLSRADAVSQVSQGGADKAPDVTDEPKANYPDMDETIANWTNDII